MAESICERLTTSWVAPAAHCTTYRPGSIGWNCKGSDSTGIDLPDFIQTKRIGAPQLRQVSGIDLALSDHHVIGSELHDRNPAAVGRVDRHVVADVSKGCDALL